jgi:hypothetical protein
MLWRAGLFKSLHEPRVECVNAGTISNIDQW